MKKVKYSPDAREKLREIKREITSKYGSAKAQTIVTEITSKFGDCSNLKTKEYL